jgi:hypothetical protein
VTTAYCYGVWCCAMRYHRSLTQNQKPSWSTPCWATVLLPPVSTGRGGNGIPAFPVRGWLRIPRPVASTGLSDKHGWEYSRQTCRAMSPQHPQYQPTISFLDTNQGSPHPEAPLTTTPICPSMGAESLHQPTVANRPHPLN